MSSSHIFARNPMQDLPKAVAGDGIYLIAEDGRRYLDACGGAAVSCLGHSPTQVIEATCDQLSQVAFAHTGFFTSQPAEDLADLLIQHAPAGIDRVYFGSGGSEAVEASLKLARQYFLEIDQPERTHIIGRRQSYHGNTLGALGSGGNQWRRRQFEPLLPQQMSHISPCHYWRWGKPGESDYDYGQRVANELETEILRVGSEKVCAFIAEPVVGATMGAVPAVDGYFQRIRDICDAYGVLLILDEVMCGMGRTGYLFASEYDGVSPDIVCIAKGLGAGIQPIGAMLCQGTIYDAIVQGSGFFQHGHTYLAHPTACAASLAVLRQLTQPGLMEQIQTQGVELIHQLTHALGRHPWVGDIRGRGLFVGIELIANSETKEPLDPSLKTAAHIKKAAMDEALMCYPMSGTVDGRHGDHILLAPPFIMDSADIKEIVTRLERAIIKVSARHASAA